jgi:hypothetical protein
MKNFRLGTAGNSIAGILGGAILLIIIGIIKSLAGRK